MIGHVIKLDDNIDSAQRGCFVWMIILLDLNKPLISMVKIGDRIQHVEYESVTS